jgi:uncharacterized protein with PQ loop repeat
VAKDYLSTWANLLGVMAAFLAAVQYIPQIWTTYHLKHVGSLSIPMMCIQTPGGYVFAGSLFARLGWAGWSTWGIFLLTATMQGILLCLAIYYEVRAHKSREARAKSPASAADLQVYTDNPSDVRTDLQAALDREDAESVDESAPLLRPTRTGESDRAYRTNEA